MNEVQPAVSVVIPARNAAATIGETLEGLAGQDLSEPFEVIVVDDGSEDETREIVLGAPIPVRLVSAGGGRAGAARNLGVAAASAPVLAFTDADCMPAREWLREGLSALEGVDLAHGPVIPDRRGEVGVFDRTLGVTRESGLYETANLFVTRESFDRVGGFEDWLFTPHGMTYGEDSLFGWKLRWAGGRTVFARRAVVDHAVFPRGPRKYVAARIDLFCVPALVARMPELRKSILLGGVFLGARTLRFDAALAGAALALRMRSHKPLWATAPYAGWLLAGVARQGRNAPLVLATELVADTVRMGALLAGSARYRALVI